VRRLLVTAKVVPISPILVTLMKEALSSSETSVLIRATGRNIPEDTILHSHRRENLKSYIDMKEITDCFFIEVENATLSWRINTVTYDTERKGKVMTKVNYMLLSISPTEHNGEMTNHLTIITQNKTM
jgi:hypothetical protein